MAEAARFRLNGCEVALADVAPTESLLRWLKRAHLTGTKEGCADGDCGACTVALIDTGADGKRQFFAVNSCLLPMGALAGREVLTVETLADGIQLHPVQQAMLDTAGSQCGYCTPGFVMSLFAGWYAGELSDRSIEGNLCRCTGYLPIRRAATLLQSVPPLPDRFSALLDAAPAARGPDPAAFFHPDSVAEAIALKSAHPQAVWFAGGTDLGVALSHGQPGAPAHIALDRITALRELSTDEESVRIGAGVRLSTLESKLKGTFPALDHMLEWFAGRQVRNRATLGGNLGTASPIGDLLPVLLALDAQVICQGPGGERSLPIDGYFLDYRKTALAPAELITAVLIERQADLRNAAYKVAKRPTDDISIVAAVFALTLDEQHRVQHLRLAYGGVAAVPLRARRTEALLQGTVLDADGVTRARESLAQEFTPLSDHRASADYRRALCGNLFARFVAEHAAR